MRGKRVYVWIVCLAVCTGCGGQLGWNKKPAKGDPYEAVKVGMTEKQVVALLGAPNKRQLFQNGEGGQSYIVLRWLASNHIITVNMMGGVVAGKRRV